LVQNQILLGHEFGVFACGAGQFLTPFQERQVFCRPFAIYGIEQEFFRAGNLLLRQSSA
jgi:hypothetical protein